MCPSMKFYDMPFYSFISYSRLSSFAFDKQTYIARSSKQIILIKWGSNHWNRGLYNIKQVYRGINTTLHLFLNYTHQLVIEEHFEAPVDQPSNRSLVFCLNHIKPREYSVIVRHRYKTQWVNSSPVLSMTTHSIRLHTRLRAGIIAMSSRNTFLFIEKIGITICEPCDDLYFTSTAAIWTARLIIAVTYANWMFIL